MFVGLKVLQHGMPLQSIPDAVRLILPEYGLVAMAGESHIIDICMVFVNTIIIRIVDIHIDIVLIMISKSYYFYYSTFHIIHVIMNSSIAYCLLPVPVPVRVPNLPKYGLEAMAGDPTRTYYMGVWCSQNVKVDISNNRE